MLTVDEVLNLNYYKKADYTGWINGMRFLIRREAPEDGDAVFHAFVWPGPLIFPLADPDTMADMTAPFSEEGRQAVVDWINGQYESCPDRFSHERKVLL